ncbi:MAG: putative porin [Roseimicrobium sp.]
MLDNKTLRHPALSFLLVAAFGLTSHLHLFAQQAPQGAAEPAADATKAPATADEPPGLEDLAHSSALFDTDAPLALANAGGMAEPTPPPAAEAPKASPNATVNLINRLVQKGILTHGEATELIQQAEADAARARAESEPEDGLAMDSDTVRVTYVPENIKTEIREQLKDAVLRQARDEGWANPRTMPEWASRFKLFGDVRLRYEGIFYPEGNDNTGSFPNFNSINTGTPFDISGTQFSPQYNVDQERQRVRLRARLGVDVNLEENFTAGLRIATGETSTPTSTNQSLGLASQGQGGNFSKYSLWLDRGFLKYEIGGQPDFNIAFLFGRFDNPFMTTSEIVWDEDVGFDGIAISGRLPVVHGLNFFFTGGAFPIFNTDLNFPSNQPAKYESGDKWLYAGQIGFDIKPTKKFNAKVAAAVYDFNKVEGRLSTPYIPLTTSDASDTDNTRPSFAQKGNTYRPIRDIIPSALNDFGTSRQYQFFGLASPFKVAAYTARLDFWPSEPFGFSILGEYALNLDYDRESINATAVNNRGPLALDETGAPTGIGEYEGGDTAWNASVVVGKPVFEEAGDWNASIGYRYVESDAVVDAFSDSDFGVGGTNVEGYTIGAAVALSKRVRMSLRWMSATQIAGPPLKSDVVLFDLTAKF